jgi:uncharacterized protein with beta-barrel porin domain
LGSEQGKWELTLQRRIPVAEAGARRVADGVLNQLAGRPFQYPVAYMLLLNDATGSAAALSARLRYATTRLKLASTVKFTCSSP